MRDNIVNVFGSKLADGLVPVDAETPGGSKLEGSASVASQTARVLSKVLASIHYTPIAVLNAQWPVLASIPGTPIAVSAPHRPQ